MNVTEIEAGRACQIIGKGNGLDILDTQLHTGLSFSGDQIKSLEVIRLAGDDAEAIIEECREGDFVLVPGYDLSFSDILERFGKMRFKPWYAQESFSRLEARWHLVRRGRTPMSFALPWDSQVALLGEHQQPASLSAMLWAHYLLEAAGHKGVITSTARCKDQDSKGRRVFVTPSPLDVSIHSGGHGPELPGITAEWRVV